MLCNNALAPLAHPTALLRWMCSGLDAPQIHPPKQPAPMQFLVLADFHRTWVGRCASFGPSSTGAVQAQRPLATAWMPMFQGATDSVARLDSGIQAERLRAAPAV